VAAVLVTLAGPGVAHAQGPTGSAPPTLTLSALARGEPVTSVLAGQRWKLAGTLEPAQAGDTVELTVTRDGTAVLSRRLAVKVAAGSTAGRFHLAVRFRTPGALTIVAGDGAATSPPLSVSVEQPGRARAGCDFEPEVVRTPRGRPALAGGRALLPGVRLATGARVAIPARSHVALSAHGAVYRARPGLAVVDCSALRLVRGELHVTTGRRGHAQLLLGDDLAVVHPAGRARAFAPRQLHFASGTGYVVSSRAPLARVHTVVGDDVVITRDGLPRLTTWPFARLPDQRDARPSDGLPEFWADGRPCSVGCRPPGARIGWPIKPFHQAHPLRSGLNEWRPANMHIGIDIQARYDTPVYAIQSGTATIAARGTSDIHVRVGDYEYWHVAPSVGDGAFVHRGAVVGRIIFAAPPASVRAARHDVPQPVAARRARAEAVVRPRAADHRRTAPVRRFGLRRGLRSSVAQGDHGLPDARARPGGGRLARAGRGRERDHAAGVQLPGLAALSVRRQVQRLRARHARARQPAGAFAGLAVLRRGGDLRSEVELPARGRPRDGGGDLGLRLGLSRQRVRPHAAAARLVGGDDLQRVGHARGAVLRPGDVDLVVAAVMADPERSPEPLPEPELALLDQRAGEDEGAVGDGVVAAEALADPVDVDGERRADAGWEGDAPLIHRARTVALTAVHEYEIRRSTRARRVRVTVHPDRRVEVVLPQRAPQRAAVAAVEELGPWIERRLRSLDRIDAELPRPDGTVAFLGESLTLIGQPGRTRVHRKDDLLLVPASNPGPALERWYRARARRVVAERLDAATARAGVAYTGLTIRAQRTRWASCSSTGAMSFNWRLLLAPPEVLDYVVEHEVCHLTHLDHSPRFWALLEARVPDHRTHARWLRRYGSTLTLPPSARRSAA
jgi:predicted metal-dependent hydrolase